MGLCVCRTESWADGKRGYILGHRLQGQPYSNEAKLKVKFYVPPFLPIIPMVGDYRVLCLDADDQYALVGQPSRKYLWILSRQSHMDDETYNQPVQKAEEGYDVSSLHNTPQSDTPPRTPKAF